MIGVFRKGPNLLKTVVLTCTKTVSFISGGSVNPVVRKWGKFSAKCLTFGAVGASLASVVFAQTVQDDVSSERAEGSSAAINNNNKPTPVQGLLKGNDNCKSKRKRQTYHSAVLESRDLVQRIKDETGSPGIVIGVSVDGKTVWSEGLGYADLENRTPITPKTVLRIASISKSITMAIVAKLWESDKLDIDAPVQKYVPDFPEKEVNGEKVTITTRQLVSHLSGIRHYEKNPKKNNKNEKQDSKDGDEKKSEEKNKDKVNDQAQGDERFKEFYSMKKFSSTKEALEIFKNDPLIYKPGSEFLYTTHGWTLVSAVLEGASGVKFPKLLMGLFKNLGMTSTYLDENDTLIYHRARNYVKNKKGKIINAPYVDNSYKWAGGGLLSTVGDLLKFGNVMLYSFQHSPENNKVQGDSISKSSSNTTSENFNITEENKHRENLNLTQMSGSSLPGYLKPDTVRKMWTVVKRRSGSEEAFDGYGMGWGVIPESLKHGCCQHQRYFVSHSGGAMGTSSVLLVYPSPKTSQGEGQVQGQAQGHPVKDEGHHQSQTSHTQIVTIEADRNTKEQHRSKDGVQSKNDGRSVRQLPQGITVAIIANTSSVGLRQIALQIAEIFENVDVP